MLLLLLLLVVVVVVEIELSFNLLKVVLALLLRAETFVCQKKNAKYLTKTFAIFGTNFSEKLFFSK